MDKINRERNTCSFIGLGTLACFVGAPFKLVFLTGLNQVGEMKAVLKLRFSHSVRPACWNRNPPAWAGSQLCGVDFKCFGTQKLRQEIQMDADIY